MKLKTHGTFLGLFLALGLFLSFAAEAPAHEYRGHGSDADINADAVGINDEAQMMKFLEHVLEHFNQVQNDASLSDYERKTELSIIGRRFREEGIFYHKATNVYSMGVNSRFSITSHPAHPQLYGKMIDVDAGSSDIGDVVKILEEESTTDKAKCQPYTHGGEDRVACGQKVNSPSGVVTTIVGLHHEEDDSAIFLPDLCSNDSFALATTAKDVYDDQTDANLEAYVQSIIEVAKNQVRNISLAVGGEDPDTALKAFQGDPQAQADLAVKVLERLYDVVACFGNSPQTKH